jgi:hypothetical protein
MACNTEWVMSRNANNQGTVGFESSQEAEVGVRINWAILDSSFATVIHAAFSDKLADQQVWKHAHSITELACLSLCFIVSKTVR